MPPPLQINYNRNTVIQNGKLCSYKFVHCDEIQVNIGNIIEKEVISAANIYQN